MEDCKGRNTPWKLGIQVVSPDLSKRHTALKVPFCSARWVSERPHGDHRRRFRLAMNFDIPEPSTAHLQATVDATVVGCANRQLISDLWQSDVEHLWRAKEGVASKDPVGEVDPPEHPRVGDNTAAQKLPVERGRVGDVLLGPVALARCEAEERGAAAAVSGRPELGHHEVAAPPDEAGVDAVVFHGVAVPRDGDGLARGRVAEVVRTTHENEVCGCVAQRRITPVASAAAM